MRTIVTNLEGSEIVLDHCTRFGKRVLVASTSEVYGDHRTEEPLHEDARRVYGPTTQKRWLYADSKAMDEYLALAYRQEREPRLRHRPPLQHRRPAPERPVRDGRRRASSQAARCRPSRSRSTATAARPGRSATSRTRSGRCTGLMDDPATSGEIYNVGSRNWISVLELARRVLELTGSSLGARLRPLRPGLRARDRRHAPSRACDREDRGRDRLGRPNGRSTRSSPT